MAADDPLKSYLQALMKIDGERHDPKPMSRDELVNVAREVGLSDAALAEAEARARGHLERGARFRQAHNYDDALAELEQAAVLMPYDADANYQIAEAYLARGRQRQQPADLERANLYLRRTLSLAPNHGAALQLQSAIVHGRAEVRRHGHKRRWIIGGVAAGVVLLLALFYFSTHNRMVALEEEVNGRWAQVENQYQRRADLVPNLVATVQAAADFERNLLREVTEARAAAVGIDVGESPSDAQQLAQYAEAQARLGAAVNRLLAVAEQYPNLKATENFRDLQHQLEGTENRIAVERRRFNEAVRDYNAAARRFPTNVMGFDAKAYFETDPANATPPTVNLR